MKILIFLDRDSFKQFRFLPGKLFYFIEIDVNANNSVLNGC